MIKTLINIAYNNVLPCFVTVGTLWIIANIESLTAHKIKSQ